MNKYDEKGNNNICPYKRGKIKGIDAEIDIDSTYCRKCWWYDGVSKRGKNNGVKEIICGMENSSKKFMNEIHLDAIYRVANTIMWNKSQACKWISRRKLEKLTGENKIRCKVCKNGRWMCNAGDVLRYVEIPKDQRI